MGVRGRIVGAVALVLCLCAAAAFASAGQLDHLFSGDGKLTTDFAGGDDDAGAIAVDTKDRVVAAGSASAGVNEDFALARYKANGNLDPTFSHDGKVTTPFGADDSSAAESVAIDTKGRIVAAGETERGTSFDFTVVRYRPTGKLDKSFSGDGVVQTSFGSNPDTASSLAIDGKGRIVVAGPSYNGTDDDFAVARYKPTGKLDHTFSGDGKVITPVGGGEDYATSVAIDLKGRPVVGGYSTAATNDFALVRYKASGKLDKSFSGDGKVTTPIGSSTDDINSIAIDAKNRIVAGGFIYNGVDDDFAVARYEPSGKLDHSFDGDGKVTTAIGPDYDDGRSLTLDRDGRIILAGRSSNGTDTDFAIVRYKPSGKLDDSFSGDGKVTTPIGPVSDFAKSVQIDGEGRIVAGGRAANATDEDFAVARYKG